MPPEPWYYRFLEIITKVGLALNLVGIGLGLCAWLVWVLIAVAAVASAKRDETAVAGAAAFAMLLATVPYLVGLVVWLLAALTMAGWSFLILDAARNLRIIRYASKH